MTLEPSPAGEAVFACDGKLRITQAEMGGEDLLVGCAATFGMKFSQPLRTADFFCGVVSEKIFRLVLKVIETWIGGKRFRRHAELPFVCPRSALNGLKVSSFELSTAGWTSVLSADRMRPSRS